MAVVKAKIWNLFRAVVEYPRTIAHRMLDPYRPELHYMRGPGPRCREKHDLQA